MSKKAELKDLVEAFEADHAKFKEKGTDAAAKRARQYLKEIKDKAHELRQEIQEKREK